MDFETQVMSVRRLLIGNSIGWSTYNQINIQRPEMKDVADYFNAKISINSSHKQHLIRCLICLNKLKTFRRQFMRAGILHDL